MELLTDLSSHGLKFARSVVKSLMPQLQAKQPPRLSRELGRLSEIRQNDVRIEIRSFPQPLLIEDF